MAEMSPEGYNTSGKQRVKKREHTAGFTTLWSLRISSNQNLEVCTDPLETSWISKMNCLEGFSKASLKATDGSIVCLE